jgi:hypothetical protein
MYTRSKGFISGLAVALCLGMVVCGAQAATKSTSGHGKPSKLPRFPASWHGHLPGEKGVNPQRAGEEMSPQGASYVDMTGAVSQCPTSNAEVDQAVDGSYVYEAWIGCSDSAGHPGIGFARSTDGGRTFGPSTVMPGSTPGWVGDIYVGGSWDPAVAVAPDGTLYVAYMVYSVTKNTAGQNVWRNSPLVAVSFDHGETFPQVTILPVPPIGDFGDGYGNWGDRDWIAVGHDGTVYVTWDYGPRADQIGFLCDPTGSCAFSGGDFNAVIQKSVDGGQTWTMPTAISPGFPYGGAYMGRIVVEPDGTLGVLYWGHDTDPSTLAVSNGTEYFTSSIDGGTTWSAPVAVGPGAGTIALPTWWIDGSLAVDSAGTLYAAWDTQNGTDDIGWLASSTDGGQTWSAPIEVTSGPGENLLSVIAAGPGDVFVAWQTPNTPEGYATFLRRFSLSREWTTPANKISPAYGDPTIWPGDTFGLSTLQGIVPAVVLSWGSAIHGNPVSEIYSSVVTLPPYTEKFHDDAGTSTVCIDSATGACQWTEDNGRVYTGTVEVYNGGTMFWSEPGASQYVYIYYDPNNHMAWGYLYDYSTYDYSSLFDSNTLDNPPGCGVAQPPL